MSFIYHPPHFLVLEMTIGRKEVDVTIQGCSNMTNRNMIQLEVWNMENEAYKGVEKYIFAGLKIQDPSAFFTLSSPEQI